MKLSKTWLWASAAAAAALAAAPASAQRVDRIVAFGDSYADDGNLFELLGKLSSHVSGVITAFEQQAALSGRSAIEQQKRLSDHAQRSLEALSNEVRSQTQAVDAAAQSMRR